MEKKMFVRLLQNQKKEEGQAVIEFILAILVLFAFIFFFIQLALVLAFGSYAQYATFMSARAYLSAGATQRDQLDRARQVLATMVKQGANKESLDRLPMIAKGEGIAQGSGDAIKGAEFGKGPNFDVKDSSSWQIGVRYTFRSRIFVLPLTPKDKKKKDEGILLTSESWLLKDPSYEECKRAMKNGWLIDNGC